MVRRHEVVQREVKDLDKGIAHLHNCMARYNALIADNAGLKLQLVNDNFHLETKISHELKVSHQPPAARPEQTSLLLLLHCCYQCSMTSPEDLEPGC